MSWPCGTWEEELIWPMAKMCVGRQGATDIIFPIFFGHKYGSQFRLVRNWRSSLEDPIRQFDGDWVDSTTGIFALPLPSQGRGNVECRMNVLVTSLIGYRSKPARLSIDNGDGGKMKREWRNEEPDVRNLSKGRMHDYNIVRGLNGYRFPSYQVLTPINEG
jgi:hypothetical protein